jgi:heat shock protein HslJ
MNKYINKYALLTFGLFTILIFNQPIFAQTCKRNYADLNGKVWQLTAIDGNAVNTDKATLSFDFDKNRVGGNGGCNGFGGTLTANGGEIKISQIISTKMFCENGSDVENKYLPKLEQVNKYKISDGKLQLLNNEMMVLEFTAKS